MLHKRIRTRENGMSLVEMLMVLGIGSIVALVIGQFYTGFFKNQVSISASMSSFKMAHLLSDQIKKKFDVRLNGDVKLGAQRGGYAREISFVINPNPMDPNEFESFMITNNCRPAPQLRQTLPAHCSFPCPLNQAPRVAIITENFNTNRMVRKEYPSATGSGEPLGMVACAQDQGPFVTLEFHTYFLKDGEPEVFSLSRFLPKKLLSVDGGQLVQKK